MPDQPSITIGSVVRLHTSSPWMTVYDIRNTTALVTYFADGKFQSAQLPITGLRLATEEELQAMKNQAA